MNLTMPSVPQEEPSKKWYEHLAFWKWTINWSSPWAWVVLGALALCILITFVSLVGCTCDSCDFDDLFEAGDNYYSEIPSEDKSRSDEEKRICCETWISHMG